MVDILPVGWSLNFFGFVSDGGFTLPNELLRNEGNGTAASAGILGTLKESFRVHSQRDSVKHVLVEFLFPGPVLGEEDFELRVFGNHYLGHLHLGSPAVPGDVFFHGTGSKALKMDPFSSGNGSHFINEDPEKGSAAVLGEESFLANEDFRFEIGDEPQDYFPGFFESSGGGLLFLGDFDPMVENLAVLEKGDADSSGARINGQDSLFVLEHWFFGSSAGRKPAHFQLMNYEP